MSKGIITPSIAEKQEKIKRYQKKLIPLNIVVCLLSLVAALSLFFMPILKVDVGKILADPEVKTYIADTVSKEISKPEAGTPSEGEGENAGFDIDVQSMLVPLMGPVFDSFAKSDISLSITAYDSLRVAQGGTNALAEILGDMTSKLTTNLVAGVKNIFTDKNTSAQVTEVMTDVMIDASLQYVKGMEDLPPEVKEAIDGLSDEDVKEFTTIFKKLDTVSSEAEAKAVAAELVDKCAEKFEYEFDPEMKEDITGMVADFYTDTMDKLAEAGNTDASFSLETLICVQLSSPNRYRGTE